MLHPPQARAVLGLAWAVELGSVPAAAGLAWLLPATAPTDPAAAAHPASTLPRHVRALGASTKTTQRTYQIVV